MAAGSHSKPSIMTLINNLVMLVGMLHVMLSVVLVVIVAITGGPVLPRFLPLTMVHVHE